MIKEFWNKRYTENDTVYGKAPNAFFKEFIDTHPPGSILLPAEGEGRNAIYAAQKGWLVNAFDYSEVAKSKALQLAEKADVNIDYDVMAFTDFKATKTFDVVALIYLHTDAKTRAVFFPELINSIKQGGFLVMECFTKQQLQNSSGGPKSEDYLYDTATVKEAFSGFEFMQCKETVIQLEEGDFHKGKADVIRVIARKK